MSFDRPVIYIAQGPPGSGKSNALETLQRLEGAPSTAFEFQNFLFVSVTFRRYNAHRITLLLFKTQIESEQEEIFNQFGHLFANRETFQRQMEALEPYSCFRIENDDTAPSVWHVPPPFFVNNDAMPRTGAA